MTRTIVLTERDQQIRNALMAAFDGSKRAQYWCKQEAFSTSDFPVAFQKINNAVIASQLEAYVPVWPKVAKRLTAENLKPTREMRLNMNTTNLLDNNAGYHRIPGTLPRIPEGTEYPGFGFTASEQEWGTAKNGGRIAFTWEAFLNDEWGQIQSLPGEMVKLATNTEETEVFRQYYTLAGGFNPAFFLPAQNLAGNPALTLQSLQAARVQAVLPPPTPPGDTPLMNTNQKWALLITGALEGTANAILNATQIRVTDANGDVFLTTPILSGIEPVVVPWLYLLSAAGNYAQTTGWALVPWGGESIYGTTVYNSFLRGHETPELRIKNDQGQALGGGSLSPWDGDFDADSIQIRLRQFLKGGTMNNYGNVWSKGTGVVGTAV